MEVTPAKFVPLGSVTKWLSGGTPSRAVDEFWSGTIPWISASTLRTTEIFDSDQCVTVDAVASGSKMAPVGATLLLVRGSALHNEILAGLVVKPVCFNQDVKALIPSPNVFPKFLTYSLLGRESELLKIVSSAGNTAGVLDTKIVQDFSVWIPSLEEQRAITTVLSDMDALLDGLDCLIAKKRAIRQATMQQLLTGQTRLPGFIGEWEVKRLGDLGATYGGLIGKNKADFGTGSAKYVPFINVIANVQIDCTAFDAVNLEATENQNKVAKGDLLFNGSSETPEEVALCSFMAKEVKNLYLNSFCFGLRVKNLEMTDGLFLAYYIRSPIGRDLMKSLAQGSTRYNLSKRALLEAQLPLPEKEEQTAIATVLSDMDAEITVLEIRRTKTRALKQAMMQELLTGRTRLV